VISRRDDKQFDELPLPLQIGQSAAAPDRSKLNQWPLLAEAVSFENSRKGRKAE
jgi:hypothetical protein